MITLINRVSTAAYTALVTLSVTSGRALRTVARDERGVGVVEYVLLMMVAVLAVGLLWSFLGPWLESMWIRIAGQ